MDEYISKQAAADAVPEELKVDFMDEFGAGFNSCRNEMLRSIEVIQPADVVPVVHGYWTLRAQHSGLKVAECSCCKKRACGTTDFCPNCGAKMDGKGEE